MEILNGIEFKWACMHLSSIASFSSLGWRVPYLLLKNNKSKKEFIRAFFDCEAYVGKKMIQVQSVNKIGLNQIKDLLSKFHIESKIYEYHRKNKNWNTNYLLCIMKKKSRRIYLKDIGFNHPLKQEKLKEYAELP